MLIIRVGGSIGVGWGRGRLFRWGRGEKEEASGVFRGVWERARGYGPYLEMKGVFLKRQKEWDRERMAEEGRETEGRKSKEEREGDG